MKRLHILMIILLIIVIFIIIKSPNNIKNLINDSKISSRTSNKVLSCNKNNYSDIKLITMPKQKTGPCSKPEKEIYIDIKNKINDQSNVESFTSPYAISYNNFYYNHNKDQNINVYDDKNWLYGTWNNSNKVI